MIPFAVQLLAELIRSLLIDELASVVRRRMLRRAGRRMRMRGERVNREINRLTRRRLVHRLRTTEDGHP